MACPWNDTTSPTAHVRELVGWSMVTVGATAPGLMTVVAVPVTPVAELVTRNPTVTRPAVVYVLVGVADVESP